MQPSRLDLEHICLSRDNGEMVLPTPAEPGATGVVLWGLLGAATKGGDMGPGRGFATWGI